MFQVTCIRYVSDATAFNNLHQTNFTLNDVLESGIHILEVRPFENDLVALASHLFSDEALLKERVPKKLDVEIEDCRFDLLGIQNTATGVGYKISIVMI